MPREKEEDIIGSDNPEDWVPNEDGVLELRKDLAEKFRLSLETKQADLERRKALEAKESQLLGFFKDYTATRKVMDDSFDKDSYMVRTTAIALAEKDPATAKAAVQRLLEKNSFDRAGEIALAIGDLELAREILKKCEGVGPTHNSGMTQYIAEKIAYAIGDTDFIAKKTQEQKDYVEKNYMNKESGSMNYYDVERIREVMAKLTKNDPAFARKVMEKDLSGKYGGRIAGEIAVALGDIDSAKLAAEKCLAGSSPNGAAKIALAIGDKDLSKRVLEEAKRYGSKTVGEITLAFGDLDSARKAADECMETCAKREWSANSTDNGESYAKVAGKIMEALADKDLDYAKNIVQKYFLSSKGRGSVVENGVPFDAVEKIALIQADKDPISARETARKFAEIGRDDISNRIVAEIFRKNVSRLQLSPEEAANLLKSGKDKTALAVGWFLSPDDLQKTLGQVNNDNVRRNAQLGGIFNKQPEAYQRELLDIAFSSPEDPKFERALARCLAHFDYEQVSNILLQKVKDAPDEKMLTRYLKTLVEIENPKGRTIANDLFANREVHPRLRRYLAKKLIAEKHWDAALEPILNERVKEGKEQEVDDTLVAMIKDLGLIPDKPAYEALEKPRLLKGATLQERVSELKSLREEFSRLSLGELKERLKDERIRQVFYLVKGGEYRYTLINNYSYEKFSLVVGKILEQQVDDEKMKDFDSAMEVAGITPQDRASICQSLREGHFPLKTSEQRSFVFDAAIDLGSEYEIAFGRLQEVWGRELHILAAANEEKSDVPLGIDDALAKLEGKEVTNPKAKKVLEFLKQGQKQDFNSMKKIADACKKELISSLKQKAKQAKDKDAALDKIAELERLNTSGLLHAYLSERFPHLKDSSILLEWESHLRETLSALEAGPVKGGTKNKRLELTFLDKGRDFIRSTRFADGRQCCFNSTNYNVDGGLGAADWIARLHADPLSFVVDIKEEGSRIVSGFVFGRMGIDPKTKRPVVMLNGIYSQESGVTMNNNILKLIEEKFAKIIGSSSIVIASKHGGKLAQKPEGYQDVKKDIQAIRALKNSDRVYDDIGTVPNGSFSFEGYERVLS